MWLSLMLACKAPSPPIEMPPTTPSPTGETGQPVADPTADTAGTAGWRWTEASSHTTATTIDLGEISALAQQDLTVTWSALTRDARGREITPATVAEVVLLEVSGDDRDAILTAMQGRGPTPDDVVDWWSVESGGGNFIRLSDLSALGAPFVPNAYFTTDAPRSWLLVLRDASGAMVHAAWLQPQAGGIGQVSITDATSSWSRVDTLREFLMTTPGEPGTLIWSDLSTDSHGDPLSGDLTDELAVFSLPAGETPTPLLDVRGRATSWYSRKLQGQTEADLGLLRDEALSAFPGFSTDASWFVALRCSTCMHPDPLRLTGIIVQE